MGHRCCCRGTKVVYAGFVGEWYIMFCDLRGSRAVARGPFCLSELRSRLCAHRQPKHREVESFMLFHCLPELLLSCFVFHYSPTRKEIHSTVFAITADRLRRRWIRK